MKKQRVFLTSLLTLGLFLVLAVGFSLAQEPEAEGPSLADVSLAAQVGSKFFYQGVLKEHGYPVTGSRDMTFRFYSDDTCTTQVGSDVVKNDVQVTDGLFGVDLEVDQDDFNGQGLWLEVEVNSAKIGCREILPVPYALSLRPGAIISDTNSYVGLNHFLFLPPYVAKYGIYARAEGTGANTTYYGVYGSGADYGVYGYSDDGAALYAGGNGVIKSAADTEIVVSPLKMVAYHGSNVSLLPTESGFMVVQPNATGTHYVYVPVDIPSVLFGTETKLKSVQIYYKCDTAQSYIDHTRVRYVDYAGDPVDLFSDSTNRTDVVWSGYMLTTTTPEKIDGSLFVRFSLTFGGTGAAHEIYIGKIVLTLTETG